MLWETTTRLVSASSEKVNAALQSAPFFTWESDLQDSRGYGTDVGRRKHEDYSSNRSLCEKRYLSDTRPTESDGTLHFEGEEVDSKWGSSRQELVREEKKFTHEIQKIKYHV